VREVNTEVIKVDLSADLKEAKEILEKTLEKR
jgi:hypothetical protein